ncbi:Uncharacterized protein HZ326_26733 [Fusarium oxysporum f. sp. albedinis]|nr:Uncharacterized protein HZ326_26733 [Fusarium oxysporum f. sp. albedinis]
MGNHWLSRRWAHQHAPRRSLSPDQMICIADSSSKKKTSCCIAGVGFALYMATDKVDETGKIWQFFNLDCSKLLNYCCLEFEAAATLTQLCTLPAVLRIASVELRWLPASRLFERVPTPKRINVLDAGDSAALQSYVAIRVLYASLYSFAIFVQHIYLWPCCSKFCRDRERLAEKPPQRHCGMSNIDVQDDLYPIEC